MNTNNMKISSTASRVRKKSMALGHQLAGAKLPQARVFYEGEDLTPHSLSHLLRQESKEKEKTSRTDRAGEMSSIQSGTNKQSLSTFKTLSVHKFKSEFRSEMFKSIRSSSMGRMSENTDDMIFSLDDKVSSEVLGPQTSEPLEECIEIYKSMPQYVNLILKETDTFFILDIQSTSVLKDSEEGALVEQDNALYEHLTVGKGRNRKVVNQEVQTAPIVLKSRETQKARPTIKNEYSFASCWDMYDSYEGTYKKKSKNVVDSDDSSSEESISSSEKSDDSTTPAKERQVKKIFANPRFQDAVEITQRLLANNNFNEQQKRFRGLADPDPFRENIEYNYKLEHLWTFVNTSITGKLPVVCMMWSPANSDILAVGYGKFYFNDKENGMVLLWNIKNPVQPERVYNFQAPVTSLSFSRLNPNLLAVGFYSGYIRIIDVSSRTIRIICQTTKDSFPNFEAVWHLIFERDENKPKEYIISFGQDGRVVKTGPIGVPSMISTQIMRVVKGEGKLKGLSTLKKCRSQSVEVCRFPSCLTAAFHPTDSNMYLVGTNEGVVYVCSKHYFHQHVNAFLAHDGAIYAVKFSPFCNKLLMTCGDDWHIRIWCEEIDEPVLELKVDMMTVQAADWSPIHSTIIASLSGKDIHIWDLQRKIYTSQSFHRNPKDCLNTTLCFTKDGRCLTVGDIEGNIHIFALEDMPFAPFYPTNLLVVSLYRALVVRPRLLHKIQRVGSLHNEPEKGFSLKHKTNQ